MHSSGVPFDRHSEGTTVPRPLFRTHELRIDDPETRRVALPPYRAPRQIRSTGAQVHRIGATRRAQRRPGPGRWRRGPRPTRGTPGVRREACFVMRDSWARSVLLRAWQATAGWRSRPAVLDRRSRPARLDWRSHRALRGWRSPPPLRGRRRRPALLDWRSRPALRGWRSCPALQDHLRPAAGREPRSGSRDRLGPPGLRTRSRAWRSATHRPTPNCSPAVRAASSAKSPRIWPPSTEPREASRPGNSSQVGQRTERRSDLRGRRS
jgi:hypothetical protein